MPANLKSYNFSNKSVFITFWILTALLYLITAKAGWVLDASGWLAHVRQDNFTQYINRTDSKVNSLYQFTQFITFLFYKVWGANIWLWWLLYVTLHAANACLLFAIFSSLLKDIGSEDMKFIPLIGILLFTISPYTSEVIAWRASYHYLQGLLFLLLIIRMVQLYISRPKLIYPLLAGLVFLLAAFSLEVFYITPLAIITLVIFYRTLGHHSKLLSRVIGYFMVPQAIIFCIYLFIFYYLYHSITPHVYNFYTQPWEDYLSKPPKYIFHILLLGRFFSFHAKQEVYNLFYNPYILIAFYGLVVALFTFLIRRTIKKDRVSLLLLTLLLCTSCCIAILIPLPFPNPELLVFYDRYTYFANAFFYTFLTLFLYHFTRKYLCYSILIVFGLCSLYFTVLLGIYWKRSAYINNRLLSELPPLGNKIVVLLNLPECMNGVPMMGADPDGEFKAMLETIKRVKPSNVIYDAASYNLVTAHDAAHVQVINDSSVRVTLNQWGTWWWYEGHGGKSYEKPDYKLDMKDIGHFYEITLKHPSSEFLLLYQVEGVWKTVDWSKKDQEQW